VISPVFSDTKKQLYGMDVITNVFIEENKFHRFHFQAGFFPEFPDQGVGIRFSELDSAAWWVPKEACRTEPLVLYHQEPVSLFQNPTNP
jgi:hypothetical protein